MKSAYAEKSQRLCLLIINKQEHFSTNINEKYQPEDIGINITGFRFLTYHFQALVCLTERFPWNS